MARKTESMRIQKNAKNILSVKALKTLTAFIKKSKWKRAKTVYSSTQKKEYAIGQAKWIASYTKEEPAMELKETDMVL